MNLSGTPADTMKLTDTRPHLGREFFAFLCHDMGVFSVYCIYSVLLCWIDLVEERQNWHISYFDLGVNRR